MRSGPYLFNHSMLNCCGMRSPYLLVNTFELIHNMISHLFFIVKNKLVIPRMMVFECAIVDPTCYNYFCLRGMNTVDSIGG